MGDLLSRQGGAARQLGARHQLQPLENLDDGTRVTNDEAAARQAPGGSSITGDCDEGGCNHEG